MKKLVENSKKTMEKLKLDKKAKATHQHKKNFVVKVKYQELNWMQQFHPKLGWRD